MHGTITHRHLLIILAIAWQFAERLRRKLGASVGERDDFYQEILLDLIQHWGAYDPERGPPESFAGTLARNRAHDLGQQLARQRKRTGGALLSLDMPRDRDHPHPISATLTLEDSLSCWLGDNVGETARVELSRALATALGHVSEADRRLCAGLALHSPTALAAAGYGSRSAIYRRIAVIRELLTCHGVGPHWDGLRSSRVMA